jgi:hypothetical protein
MKWIPTDFKARRAPFSVRYRSTANDRSSRRQPQFIAQHTGYHHQIDYWVARSRRRGSRSEYTVHHRWLVVQNHSLLNGRCDCTTKKISKGDMGYKIYLGDRHPLRLSHPSAKRSSSSDGAPGSTKPRRLPYGRKVADADVSRFNFSFDFQFCHY